MSNLQYFNYAGWGDIAAKELHYSQAVKVGDRIELSGQGGWPTSGDLNLPDSEEAQIENAFINIEAALKKAGAPRGLGQVFRVTSYHCPLGEQTTDLMVAAFRKYFPEHRPIWTEIGVTKLGLPTMKVEIEVVAIAE